MCNPEDIRWNFKFEGKLWALTLSSKPHGIHPCKAFQEFSIQRHASIVQVTPPVGGEWKRWKKDCKARLFIMEPFAESEAKSLRSVIITSILFILFDLILQHDIEPRCQTFPRHFKKWGPSAYICDGLARGYLTEGELQVSAIAAARQFVKDPNAVTMETPIVYGPGVLFTAYPSHDRSGYTLKVTTPYLCSFVM